MNRRRFIATTGALAAAAAAGPLRVAAESRAPELKPATSEHLPRWRGFNLLEKFIRRPEGNPAYVETDFAWMAEWGFDFARLPMSYLCWIEPGEWLKLREAELKHVDAAVEFGRKHGVHVNLNLHRAPGYCVNPPKEPMSLWEDEPALDACAFHWAHLAKRYKGIPNTRVSFDLLNEPADIREDTYVRVVKRLVEAIRAEDPERLIIADGLRWGTVPVPGLAKLGIGQSTRGYEPMEVTHYQASWVFGSNRWPEPTWPLLRKGKDEINKDWLRRQRIKPWQDLERSGAGVHVGEWGAFSHTPHAVVLAWMRDCLDLWKEVGWGWALWNLRGDFGILDSRRKDVVYEPFREHLLDRKMLTLLQSG